MNAAPRLETERMVLRQWREDDFEPFCVFYEKDPFSWYMGGLLSRDDAWRRMAMLSGHWSLRGYGFYAAEEKSSGLLAGFVGPWLPEGWPEREIGWATFAPFRGRGYAVEAAQAVRAHLYRDLKWPTLISIIHPINIGSQSVARRLGCVFEKMMAHRGADVQIYRHPAPQTLAV